MKRKNRIFVAVILILVMLFGLSSHSFAIDWSSVSSGADGWTGKGNGSIENVLGDGGVARFAFIVNKTAVPPDLMLPVPGEVPCSGSFTLNDKSIGLNLTAKVDRIYYQQVSDGSLYPTKSLIFHAYSDADSNSLNKGLHAVVLVSDNPFGGLDFIKINLYETSFGDSYGNFGNLISGKIIVNTRFE